MIILDSSVWVARLHNQDTQHQQGQLVFESLTEPVLVPECVLGEVCTVLTRRAGKETANSFIDRVVNNKETSLWRLSSNELAAVIEFYQRHPHAGLSFVDVTLCFLSARYRVITFDKKLAQAIKRLRDNE